MQDGPEGEYTVHFNSYEEGGKVRHASTRTALCVILCDKLTRRQSMRYLDLQKLLLWKL